MHDRRNIDFGPDTLRDGYRQTRSDLPGPFRPDLRQQGFAAVGRHGERLHERGRLYGYGQQGNVRRIQSQPVQFHRSAGRYGRNRPACGNHVERELRQRNADDQQNRRFQSRIRRRHAYPGPGQRHVRVSEKAVQDQAGRKIRDSGYAVRQRVGIAGQLLRQIAAAHQHRIQIERADVDAVDAPHRIRGTVPERALRGQLPARRTRESFQKPAERR